uniref:Nuclease HARBI1 n=1 Tax=Romanomermis culicivorax TaxID=13658 RepID=A0A915J200_ROMCU
MIALRYYATGTFQIVCGDDFYVTKATANRAVWAVTNALIQHLHNFIKFMPENECDETKNKLYRMAQFPGVLGAVRGTHIRIQRPAVDENAYINRKYYPSINV